MGLASPFPNENLKPEKTKSWEVGLNARFFGGKLNFDATWYRSDTFNQTFESTPSSTSGYSSVLVQAGQVRNSGLEMLLNYIVTPALLIYAAILYLYMAKILVTWTLPEGGVAYLVFGFTLFALAVQALQPLLQKRMYDWFFDRFSLISLPTQVLFWIGVLRRTGEYGLTEPRVYLLVSGGLMTLCVVLFLARRTGRYFYVGVRDSSVSRRWRISRHSARSALRSTRRYGVPCAWQSSWKCSMRTAGSNWTLSWPIRCWRPITAGCTRPSITLPITIRRHLRVSG